MMPRIAVLYRTSMDDLYDMDAYYNEKHTEEYRKRVSQAIRSGENERAF